MPVDDEAITAALLGEPELAELLASGDVYLLGAQLHRRAGPVGEWDLLVLLPEDRPLPERLATPFGEDSARLAGPPNGSPVDEPGNAGLGGVAVELCGPESRRRREARNLAIWHFELAHAHPLHPGWGGGDTYRAQVAAAFVARREQFACREYVHFRMHRKDAAAAVRNGDALAATLTGALAVRSALRCWLLWAGRPYPNDAWLRAYFAEDPRGDDVLAAARRVLHDQATTADRAAALHQLRWLLDRQARAAGAPDELLAAWWAFPELMEPALGGREVVG